MMRRVTWHLNWPAQWRIDVQDATTGARVEIAQQIAVFSDGQYEWISRAGAAERAG
jgi:hypothetical protein